MRTNLSSIVREAGITDLEIKPVQDISDPAVLSLVVESDEYLTSLYPPESNHAEPLEALVSGRSSFFAAYLGDRLVACGAVKLFRDDTSYGEIKRVYVRKEFRGKRCATAVIRHLENFLLKNGVDVARLEAGPMQPEALGLYRKLGYTETGPFGAYQPDPLSVFMEKKLVD